MKNQINKSILLLAVMLFLSVNMLSQNPNFHIYLCIGQSNMEGSAQIEEQDKTLDKRFVMMQSSDCTTLGNSVGNWYPAVPPLSHCDVGLSPADYFGRTMIETLPANKKVGVINVAIGGCDIRLFDKENYQDYTTTYKEDWFVNKVRDYGGNPYERLISLAKQAQKDGVIKGILLHQGETNTGDENWPLYVEKVYNNILKDLALNPNEVPLLAGEMVHEDQGGKCAHMNPIINKLPKTIPTAHVISSSGCQVREDRVHFNAEGVRELGKRYALKMLLLEGYLPE